MAWGLLVLCKGQLAGIRVACDDDGGVAWRSIRMHMPGSSLVLVERVVQWCAC